MASNDKTAYDVIHQWDGPIPDLVEDFEAVGDVCYPPTPDMLKAYEECARYTGEGRWYIAKGNHGVAVVLLGHPDGKRRYIVAETYLLYEEPAREAQHDNAR